MQADVDREAVGSGVKRLVTALEPAGILLRQLEAHGRTAEQLPGLAEPVDEADRDKTRESVRVLQQRGEIGLAPGEPRRQVRRPLAPPVAEDVTEQELRRAVA